MPLMDFVEEWLDYFEGLFLDDALSTEDKIQLLIMVHHELFEMLMCLPNALSTLRIC